MDSQLTQVQEQAPTPVTSKRRSAVDTSLHGLWLIFVRVICIIFVVYTLSFFSIGLELAFVLHRCSGLTCVLPIPEALVYFAVAALIFWRKSDDWMALLVALMLVLMVPMSTLPEALIALLFNMPVMRVLLDVSVYLASAFFLLFLFLFPNGRFWPRWSFWLVEGSLLWLASWFILPGSLLFLNIILLVILLIFVLFILSLRFEEVLTPIERQQTKWVVAGTSIALLGGLVMPFTDDRAILLLIPLTIGIAVLRYRLYDIDVIIRRTLVYSTLTVILALLYVGLVIGLESLVRLFTGRVSQSPVIIVASTLAIAALFQPLRHRIQRIIDRRFYRSKYDAAKILASFSTTLGNEVDLDQLREQLLVVVQEAMRPAHVSLWLQQYGRQAQQQYTLVMPEQAVSRQPSSPQWETGMADTSQEMLRPPSGGISRRAVIIGLATGGIALAGGILGQWLLKRYPIFVYTGHSGAVFDAAWSPDGRRIGSGSADKTVQVWDALDGSHVFTYRGHTDAVYTVAWSPDGKRIASCSKDKTVQVWDALDGSHVFTYRGHKDQVIFMAWSPDGKRLASGGGNTFETNKTSDPTVQLWDAIDGHHIFTYRGHTDSVFAIAWSPDGRRIASCSKDKTVQVWDARDGHHIFTYTGHTDGVIDVAWSPDGKHLASAGADKTVQVWDATDGHHIFTYTGHTDWVFGVSWSPDGTRIASGGDKTDQVWDAANGGNVIVYNNHTDSVIRVTWSPDGKLVASSSFDGTVQIWSPA
jgi:Tol biopolymer transport system component